MTHDFDAAYWEDHWRQATDQDAPPHPYLSSETAGLSPTAALDAGCGRGAEARWLAAHGWRVTAADISPTALAYAAARAEADGLAARLDWVAADLSTWEPDQRFDLVVSSYAHPAMPQLAFYERLATWVAPGGTLLLVGHLHGDHEGTVHEHGQGHEHGEDHDDQPPPEATTSLAAVTDLLATPDWTILTAAEHQRRANGHTLHDVVVRARRA